MSSRTILIFSSESLLAGGVRSLLEALDNFIVANIPLTRDMVLSREIERSKPDIVIIEDEMVASLEPSQVLELLRTMSRMRLIVLDTQISKMDVYDKQEFFISHPDHFIEALG